MRIKKLVLSLSLIFACFTTELAIACSRFTYTAADNTVFTGRSMDWVEDIKTDLWAFPAGIARKGDPSP